MYNVDLHRGVKPSENVGSSHKLERTKVPRELTHDGSLNMFIVSIVNNS